MTKLLKRLIILGILVVIVLSIFKVIDLNDIKNKFLMRVYKLDYSDYVDKYSSQYDVDKYLIYAIIKAESNFKKMLLQIKAHKDLCN